MRAVQTFIVGLFVISALVLVMGPLVEPIAAIVQSNEAVQSLGWADNVGDIQTTILRWVPLLFIAYLATWAGMWVFRRGRTTGVRR